MLDLPPDVLHRIGNTTLMPLRNIVPQNGARMIFARARPAYHPDRNDPASTRARFACAGLSRRN
jgi:hypothetical protein